MKREESPFPAALAMLARRDRTEAELRRMLGVKGFSGDPVDQAILRLRELGYLDDAAFARRFAAGAMAGRKAFGRRLLLELERRGISREQAAEAVREAAQEEDEEAAAREALQRKYRSRPEGADPGERRRMAQFLLRRGFAPSVVFGILNE
ncbi:MAG TPA: RecX family transcriptional regulator [Verrucomicrobiae bacterium]|nr:RecX family transcriptional regulator [Verrucomicrobiae bacterium]